MIRYLLIIAGFVALSAVTGCEQALFPEELPRTQYERFDRLRGEYVPVRRIKSEQGTDDPMLRERLAPELP